MNTGGVRWVKAAGGYASECGRFTIVYNDRLPVKRPRWGVTDTTRADPVCPQYRLAVNCHTLAAARRTAERWAAPATPPEEVRPC